MSAMRRIFTLSVAWLAAAVVAAVVAWQGVRLVGDQVTDDRDGMLSGSEIDAALTGGGGGIPLPPTTTTATPPSTTAADAGAGGTGSGTSTAGSTTPSRGTAPATGSNGTSGSGGQPAPAPAPAPAAVVRPYSVTGGTASISFSPAGVEVLWARPASGWSVKTELEGSAVRVEFESDDARSRIDAWWADGPQDRVEDDGGSGGSGRG